MKKIPTLFEREFENHRIVRILPNISPDLAWVMAGDGVATIKWDGACCAVINGVFYKRYDAKHGKPIPSNAIKCQENADPVTGHLPCWVPCNRAASSDKWFWDEAADDFEIWEADCTMKYCLKEPEALYDFITGTLKPVPVSSGESTSQQE